jgi:hypothetical protein
MTNQFQETNLKQFRGDTGIHSFTFTTSAGAVKDLTGHTITAVARTHPDHAEKLFDTASTTGMAIATGTNGSVYASGIVVLLITPAISNILPDICYYDIQSSVGGVITTLASGLIVTSKDIAR